MDINKRLDNLIQELKELDQDIGNIITLGCDVRQLDAHMKKLLK